MKHYKYLVMVINGINGKFLTSDLISSGRGTEIDTNLTYFKPHDFGGGHENDTYWNSPDSLLLGFTNWYMRNTERTAYNMGSRICSAVAKYKFFRVEDTLDEDFAFFANTNLKQYEITEQTFISDIMNSHAMKTMVNLFGNLPRSRPEQEPVSVEVYYNKVHNTWSWVNDYLQVSVDEDCQLMLEFIPFGFDYDKAVIHISTLLDCEYRFGGNDSYHKRKEKEAKENK